MDNRWMKIITDEGITSINDIVTNFIFLDAKPEYPSTQNENTNINGVDGELPSVTSFAPFNLVVNCGFDGYDEKDLYLFERDLRKLFFNRKSYYIVTSNEPGIKYPVQSPTIQEDILDFASTKYEISFPVYTGYAESLKETDEFSLSSGDWQFEGGLLADDEIKYKHDKTSFKIYNGSSDVINPLLRHKFKLLINIDSPKGFKITNKTTGDVFKYKKDIKISQTLTISGVHPFIDNKRVGNDTNWQWLTLDKGFNEIEITGENISNVQTHWVFPFIYR